MLYRCCCSSITDVAAIVGDERRSHRIHENLIYLRQSLHQSHPPADSLAYEVRSLVHCAAVDALRPCFSTVRSRHDDCQNWNLCIWLIDAPTKLLTHYSYYDGASCAGDLDTDGVLSTISAKDEKAAQHWWPIAHTTILNRRHCDQCLVWLTPESGMGTLVGACVHYYLLRRPTSPRSLLHQRASYPHSSHNSFAARHQRPDGAAALDRPHSIDSCFLSGSD